MSIHASEDVTFQIDRREDIVDDWWSCVKQAGIPHSDTYPLNDNICLANKVPSFLIIYKWIQLRTVVTKGQNLTIVNFSQNK